MTIDQFFNKEGEDISSPRRTRCDDWGHEYVLKDTEFGSEEVENPYDPYVARNGDPPTTWTRYYKLNSFRCQVCGNERSIQEDYSP